MLVGIVVMLLIPIVAGLLLWYTDWAESAVLAAVPLQGGEPADPTPA